MNQAERKLLSRLLSQVENAYDSATRNHPAPNPNMRELFDAVGDVTVTVRGIEEGTEFHTRLVTECVQVAAAALRVAIQGDA